VYKEESEGLAHDDVDLLVHLDLLYLSLEDLYFTLQTVSLHQDLSAEARSGERRSEARR